MLTKLLIKILKNKKTTLEDRQLILETLLESITVVPITDIVTFDNNGTLLLSGKTLNIDQAIALRESAIALQKNQFYKVIKEQIAMEAIKIGVHKGNTLEQIMFPKAALWIQQQEMELIAKMTLLNDEKEV